MVRVLSGGDLFWLLGGSFSIIIFLLSGCLAGTDEQKLSVIPIYTNGFIEVQEIGTSKSSNPKLDSSLSQLLGIYQRDGIAGAQVFAKTHGLILEDEFVQVVVMINPMEVEKITDTITNLGGDVQGNYGGRIQALVPIDVLETLAEHPEIQRIREPRRPSP